MKISVNAPSYKRPNKVLTLNYLPFCRIWVDEGEFPAYKANYPDADIVSCPKGVQGNVSRIRNWILAREFERGMDVVCMVDDDLSCLEYFYYANGFAYNKQKVKAEEFLPFLEKYSLMAQDIGAKLWGVNCNADAMAFRYTTPFSTVSFVGGPFQCYLKGNRCKYDETLSLKEDYDMVLQQLNKERVVLRVNNYHYYCKQSENAGGCATYRNRERERQQLRALKAKWGGTIVHIDTTNKGRTKKQKKEDYNPIIKTPIKGV